MVLSTILLAVIWTINGQNSVSFVENWNSSTSNLFDIYASAQEGTAISGYPDPNALDGRSLKLTLNPNVSPGVNGAPAAETNLRYGYGTFWARAKTANCSAQPNAGVVTGIFTYFNNGSDLNGNGLPDNDEIDFEWLCAEPEVVYLTIWTDYQPDPVAFRQVIRSINLKTGTILMECFREQFGWCSTVGQPLNASEQQPTTITPIPNYDSSTQYYYYGITYLANQVIFKIFANGVTYTLWNYQGPTSRIPDQPMYFMHNVWHTATWYPMDNNGSDIQTPEYPVNVYIDMSNFTLPNN
jgi:hypothetical protein